MNFRKLIRIDGRMDKPTDGLTNRRTETVPYRDARMHLKRYWQNKHQRLKTTILRRHSAFLEKKTIAGNQRHVKNY